MNRRRELILLFWSPNGEGPSTTQTSSAANILALASTRVLLTLARKAEAAISMSGCNWLIMYRWCIEATTALWNGAQQARPTCFCHKKANSVKVAFKSPLPLAYFGSVELGEAFDPSSWENIISLCFPHHLELEMCASLRYSGASVDSWRICNFLTVSPFYLRELAVR